MPSADPTTGAALGAVVVHPSPSRLSLHQKNKIQRPTNVTDAHMQEYVFRKCEFAAARAHATARSAICFQRRHYALPATSTTNVDTFNNAANAISQPICFSLLL